MITFDGKQIKLMIGDYVSFNDRIMRVLAIGEKNTHDDHPLTLHEIGGGIWQNIPYSDVWPICITEDMLFNNGWEKSENYTDFFPEYRLYLDKKRTKFLEIRKHDTHVYRYCGLTGTVGFLRYVHQLQRAIRLCGGKEIVL